MTSTSLTASPVTVSAEGAQRVLAASVAQAHRSDAVATVAVVDAQGHLKAYLRMDGAALIGVELSRQKAWTAVAMGGADTGALATGVSGNAQLLAALTTLPGVALLAGGVPLQVDGVVVGAVGVSGPSGGLDTEIANAGALALGTSES